MAQPIPFSVSCYQTNYFSSSANPPSGRLDQLSEHLKKVARCLYMLGVSTLIAPCGVFCHLSLAVRRKIQSHFTNDEQDAQELSALAWNHFDAAGKDGYAFIKGSLMSSPLPMASVVAVQQLKIGVRYNYPANLAIGLGSIGFEKFWIDKMTHLPLAWNSLANVKTDIETKKGWAFCLGFLGGAIIGKHLFASPIKS